MWKQAACGVASVSYISLAILIILHFTATQNGSWSLPQHIHTPGSNFPQRFNLSVTQGSCNCTLHQQVHAQLWTNAVSIDCHCPSTRDLGVSCDSPVATPAPVQAERDLQTAVLKEVVKEPCLPVEEAHHIVHKVEEPWYAKGKIWHYPMKFPRCTMDACFNYSRCEQLEDLLIYSYKEPALPPRYFRGINQTRWHTNDPEKACLFFVFLDTPGLFRPAIHPSELPHWNGGLNHVLVTFWDKWIQKGPDPESIGFASVMISDLHETTYRTGFDVGIPLPPFRHFKELLNVEPFNRKYLLTFRGLRYLNRNMTGEGVLRSHDAFRAMNNGNDIIIAISCKHPVNDEVRQEDPSLGAHCDEDDALYERYDFNDLMNSTFGLAPAGIQSNSYRFAELLSAGTIPVLIADNYVKPYETLVQWHKCILQFPSTEMQRIVPAVRGMRRKEVERRQRYCIHVYQEIFSSEEALLRSAINAQKVRFMGAFPAWIREDEEIY